MVIIGEVVALQHQLVSNMLINILPQIKPQFIPYLSKSLAQLTVSKVSLSGIRKERVMLRMEAAIKASRVMLWTETTIERKTGVNNHEILQRFVDGLVSIDARLRNYTCNICG